MTGKDFKIKIEDMSYMERPYEKLEKYGAEYLSEAELLAIILKSGTKEKSSVDLAKELIKLSGGKIRDIFYLDKNEYLKIKGIGRVKALQIMAIGEIIKRVERPIGNEDVVISSTEDAAKYLMPELRYLKKEKLVVIFLDSKNAVRKKKIYTSDGLNSVEISPMDIIKEGLVCQMPNVIVAHNHPSGRVKESNDDILFTEKLKVLCKEFGLELLDHIIIGDGNYKSII